MRGFGLLLLLIGVGGYFYCSSQLSALGPVPEGLSLGAAFEHPAGRWEVGTYASAAAGVFGALMAAYPRGR